MIFMDGWSPLVLIAGSALISHSEALRARGPCCYERGESGGVEEKPLNLNARCVFRRVLGLVTGAYLIDLLPALAAGEPPHCVFLSVKAVRKNMYTALSGRNDEFISTVVRCA